MRLCSPPCIAEWRWVESFRLEQPCGRRDVLFAFADLTVAGERSQQQLMDVRVEWRQHQPLLQIEQHLGIRSDLDELLQQCGAVGAELTALCREPAIEG